MLEKEMIKKVQDTYKTEIAQKYTTFLAKYPEIFFDLTKGSHFNFAIYNSLESYDDRSPVDVFNVSRNGQGIEIQPGKVEDSDLELALSIEAIEKLIQTNTKIEYAKLLGSFYNFPDEEKGWIDFVLHKRTQALIDMGYGKFAQTAGIIEDEYNVI
jgi:hypothetical protein